MTASASARAALRRSFDKLVFLARSAAHPLQWALSGATLAMLLSSPIQMAQAQGVSVSGGTPSYSQAIAVPPGVAGMSPNIGLYYAGGGVNGPVGHGWGVQGLSTITRCPA